jgi:hypothetical protein
VETKGVEPFDGSGVGSPEVREGKGDPTSSPSLADEPLTAKGTGTGLAPDFELDFVLGAWPSLPQAFKAGILAMVHAARAQSAS